MNVPVTGAEPLRSRPSWSTLISSKAPLELGGETTNQPNTSLPRVAPQLVEMGIRWSHQLGFKGRIGLHSLPQAEAFYRVRCRMTDLGLDTGCYNLCYFEMTEAQSNTFLAGASHD